MRKNRPSNDTFLKNWLIFVLVVTMLILCYLGYTYFMNSDNEAQKKPNKRPHKRPHKPHRTHRDYNNDNDKQPSGWKALKEKAEEKTREKKVLSALKGIKKFNLK